MQITIKGNVTLTKNIWSDIEKVNKFIEEFIESQENDLEQTRIERDLYKKEWKFEEDSKQMAKRRKQEIKAQLELIKISKLLIKAIKKHAKILCSDNTND